MIPERLATIRANDAEGMETFAHQHRRELLAEVDGLTAAMTEQAKELEWLRGRIHELERKPRCGRTDPGAFEGSVLGPCMLEHGHGGMHQEANPPEWPTHPGARWSASSDEKPRTDRNPFICDGQRCAALANADRDKFRAHAEELGSRLQALEAERAQLRIEWAATHPRHGWTEDCRHDEVSDEAAARRLGSAGDGWYVEQRLVGPWVKAPDGAGNAGKSIRLMGAADVTPGETAKCIGCGAPVSVYGHDGLKVGYVTSNGVSCGSCCDAVLDGEAHERAGD